MRFLHRSEEGGHFIEVNPFSDKSIRKEFPSSLPVIDGMLTCVTCHNPHGGTGIINLLRKDYVDFAVKSKQINPHEKRVFCASCHDKFPEAGVNTAVKFGNDVAMCNWCHKTSQDQGDHHPLNIAMKPDSKSTKVTKELPLADGKVTCLSCHERKFECRTEKTTEKIASKNPNYLIGGPYRKKNEICYKCHIKSEMEKTNPHEMLKPDGAPIASQCKFCHSAPVEKLVEGGKSPGLNGDIDFICILCHSDRNHPGTRIDGTSPNHLVKLSNERKTVVNGRIVTSIIKNLKKMKDMPFDLLKLDSQKTITCATCHQVHQAGLMKSEKNKSGGTRSMLRMTQDDLCATCHSY